MKGGHPAVTVEDVVTGGDVSHFSPLPGASYGLPQHLRKVDFDGGGDAKQRFQRGIPHSSLDVTDHLLRKAGPLGNPVHGKPPLFALAP